MEQPPKSLNEPKTKRVKRRYDEAFRRNAVALVESSGRPLEELAAELGVLLLEPAGLEQGA